MNPRTRAGSEYVFYASQCGARLDSNVITGGGADDTAAIQAVLDKAPELGRLHLVIDGAALVRGLTIHGNTTLECLNPSCGFFLAAQSNGPILRNAHKDFEVRHDRNITLLGGTWNHNCREQLHHPLNADGSNGPWVIAFEFYGVENLTVRDLTIRNQRTFAMLLANWQRVVMENISIDLPDRMPNENQDGLHFWGPGRFLTLRNIQGCSGDDFISLAPDEFDYRSGITDVLIDGVQFDDVDQGFRLMSRKDGRLDRVIIRNVTGTYRSFGFSIGPFFTTGGGNLGNIIFDTVDLRASEPNYDWTTPFLFRINGNAESMILRNLSHHQPADVRPIVEIGWPDKNTGAGEEGTFIGSLVIDGLHVVENNVKTAGASHIKVLGRVDNMVVRNVEIVRSADMPQAGCLIETIKGSDIGVLQLNGVSVNRMCSLLSHRQGHIGSLHVADVLSSEMSGAVVDQNAGGTVGSLTHDGQCS